MTVFAAVLATTAIARAQMPAAGGDNPLSASVKGMFDNIKRNITEAAAKMPEENYGFKPTPEVRSFGEIVGHLADANYLLCSRAKGEKNPNDGNSFEKKTAKADLVKALNDAVAYCDGVYGRPPTPPAQPDDGRQSAEPAPGPQGLAAHRQHLP